MQILRNEIYTEVAEITKSSDMLFDTKVSFSAFCRE